MEQVRNVARAPSVQPQHGRDRARVALPHAERGRFPHAAATEYSDALPAPTGEEGIHGANAAADRLTNGDTFERKGGGRIEQPVLLSPILGLLVERLAASINHPSQHVVAYPQHWPLAP